MLGTPFRAALVRMAGVAPCVTGDGGQSLRPTRIANIIDERPDPVQRRWAGVFRVPRHHVTRRKTHGAADTFYGRICGAALLRLRVDHGKIRFPVSAGLESHANPLLLLEKRGHFDTQVLNDGKVAERLNP